MSLYCSLYCCSLKLLFYFTYPCIPYYIQFISYMEWDTIHYIYTHSIYKTKELATIQVYTKIHRVDPTIAIQVHWTNSVMFWHSTSIVNTWHHHSLNRCRSSVHIDHSWSSLNSVCTGDLENACETWQTQNHSVDNNWFSYHLILLSDMVSSIITT